MRLSLSGLAARDEDGECVTAKNLTARCQRGYDTLEKCMRNGNMVVTMTVKRLQRQPSSHGGIFGTLSQQNSLVSLSITEGIEE